MSTRKERARREDTFSDYVTLFAHPVTGSAYLGEDCTFTVLEPKGVTDMGTHLLILGKKITFREIRTVLIGPVSMRNHGSSETIKLQWMEEDEGYISPRTQHAGGAVD